MNRTKTIVSIGGKQYTLCGEESAEYIHRVALKVNSKLEEIKNGNRQIPNIDLAMLTAINIADEYMKVSDELEEAKKELERLRKIQPMKAAAPSKVSQVKK